METLATVLVSVAAAFAVYWTFRIKKVIPMIVNIGMVIGILMVLFPALKLSVTGIYIYMGFVILAFLYGLADKDRMLIDRLVICLMTAGIFLYWLFSLMHWAGNIWAAVLVLLAGIAGILTRSKLREELGFLVIISADAIAILLENNI